MNALNFLIDSWFLVMFEFEKCAVFKRKEARQNRSVLDQEKVKDFQFSVCFLSLILINENSIPRIYVKNKFLKILHAFLFARDGSS